MKSIIIIACFLLAGLNNLKCQVKITDTGDTAITSNAILELSSADKGFLAPRVALQDINETIPLATPVDAGMLVYSSGGILPDGFYYWNGSNWNTFDNSVSLVTLSASDTLSKTGSVILASGDITLTLPQIAGADNGLAITVKNVGSHLDLISVIGYAGATIDGHEDALFTRWRGQTFIAWEGNWISEHRETRTDNLLDVSPHGSFTSISEVFEFLSEHMIAPMVIRLSAERYTISETQVIDLPFAVTIQALSFGSVTVGPAPEIDGKPLFRCVTESYFKMIMFDATLEDTYGTQPGEDAIRLVGDGSYHEIKDCTFDRFYNTIVDSTDSELWLFECDISNAQHSGVLLESDVAGAKFRVSETDFIDCRRGITMSKGSEAVVQINMGSFHNALSTDSAIVYRPAHFSFTTMIITNNSWNNAGKFIAGFDFSRSDGRDADAFIEANTGIEDMKPHCKINVVNNTSTVSCTLPNVWYKAAWTNTSYYTKSWAIDNNKITYLPVNSRDAYVIISGNVSVSSQNRVITICIVKDGIATQRFGETALRITTANQPFQFSTVVYLEDVEQDDYFEVYCASSNGWDVLTFQDINMMVNTQ